MPAMAILTTMGSLLSQWSRDKSELAMPTSGSKRTGDNMPDPPCKKKSKLTNIKETSDSNMNNNDDMKKKNDQNDGKQDRHNKKVLIVVDHGSESMDVQLTAQVFLEFGMSITFGGILKSESYTLTRNTSICSETSLHTAASQNNKQQHQWNVIVLPGGNKAVEQLIRSKHYATLLQNHLEKPQESKDNMKRSRHCGRNGGIIAAMGASATQGLSDFIDPLGPTMYPIRDGTATVVNREYQDQIFTAPGLGTATELALTIGEHLYGQEEALRVAKTLGYIRGRSWYMDRLTDLKSHYNNNNNNEDCEGAWKSYVMQVENDEMITNKPTGFWEIFWPYLSRNGWECDYDEKRWGFRCSSNGGRHRKRAGRRNRDWFDSQQHLLKHLYQEKNCLFQKIMDLLHHNQASESEDEDDAQEERVSQPSNMMSQDSLFDHVVWKRLRTLGWSQLPADLGGGYETPSDGRRVKLTSRLHVIQHLLADPELRVRSDILAIVDLYTSCQRLQTQMKEKHNFLSPSEIEAETKRQYPALSMY